MQHVRCCSPSTSSAVRARRPGRTPQPGRTHPMILPVDPICFCRSSLSGCSVNCPLRAGQQMRSVRPRPAPRCWATRSTPFTALAADSCRGLERRWPPSRRGCGAPRWTAVTNFLACTIGVDYTAMAIRRRRLSRPLCRPVCANALRSCLRLPATASRRRASAGYCHGGR